MTNKHAEPLTNIDRYAVLGNPIAHSKSPLIHAAFAKQTQQNISYERVLAPLDGFVATVKSLINQGFKGANVTVPFKFEAFQLCDAVTERAQFAGAVNTLTFEHGKIMGDNTDGAGLVADIQHHLEYALQGASILLLGAGGAAQGVLLPLLNAQAKSITIANRSVEKAQAMAQKFANTNIKAGIAACRFEDLFPPFLTQAFDVVINATSTGLSEATLNLADEIFSNKIQNKTLAYDMMYGRETPFMAQAKHNGAMVADGLGMLVEQAAEAFYGWRGVRPATTPVIKALRDGTLV